MPAGRFAPSPTGPLHLGNLRTALVAWLFARASGSRFVVRVEDLDPVAARAGHEQRQLDDLAALGIDWDGPVLHQSTRIDHYEDALAQLGESGLTYPCYCTRREIAEAASAPHEHLPEGAYPGTCRELTAEQRAERATSRPAALRLRAEQAWVGFDDRVHGRFDGLVDDFVVRRNDGTPAYNLAVVVDDAEQGIGEVVRGDDLLATTPRQILLAERLGLTVPSYAHVPLVLGPTGDRLAKRDGAVTLAERRARGETPGQVLALLASSLGLVDPQDPHPHDGALSTTQLLARFEPDRIPRVPWILGSHDL